MLEHVAQKGYRVSIYGQSKTQLEIALNKLLYLPLL